MTTRHPTATETLPAMARAYGRLRAWEMAATTVALLGYVPEEVRAPATRACQAFLSDFFAEMSALLAELNNSPAGVEQHQ
ncbi:MAG: hypothetical protein DCC49_09285 [Acidobacteria bacterium]|nr:MAG: hypothetical protein DCC49_09285 [Acidobacteriota bacterium]